MKLIVVESFRLKPPVGHLDRDLRRLSTAIYRVEAL